MPPTPDASNGSSSSHGSSSMASSSKRQSHNHKRKILHDVNSRFAEETFFIVKHVIYSLLGRTTNAHPSPVARRFEELVRGILEQHDVYSQMCFNLQLSPNNLDEVYHGIVQSIFEDDRINWGRLVALVGFSVKVAEHLRGYGNDYDDRVVELTSHVLVQKTGTWILAKGGWADVVNHFQDNKSGLALFSVKDNSWFKGVLVTATATIGLGALLAISCK